MESTQSKIEKSVTIFKDLIAKGGPQKTDYPLLDATINALGVQLKNGEITKEDLAEIHQLYDEEFMQHTMQGHALKKPYGYPGDFMMIDMAYSHSTYPKYQLWEAYTHNQAVVQAVRNRKDYFVKTLLPKCKASTHFSLLNIASGPARDLLELYQQIENSHLKTICVEHDPRAIKYASKLTEPFKESIEYRKANVFKYESDQQFDVIWSAGLFDYFDDATFINTLKKMLSWTKDHYEIIIGNLKSNSSDHYLEIMTDWHLYYREESDLIRIAKEAGVSESQIFIGKEVSGVNLFLHIKNI